MQEWLDNNDMLIYFTHNESKSVTIERFPNTSKAELYFKNGS